MNNFLLTIAFDGTAYHGWQTQQNAVSVQQTLETAMEKLFHEKISVNGCSRTDAGVHARMFCCNFRTEKNYPCENIVAAVNAYLPKDIAVLSCRPVPEDFHARFDCTEKEYEYLIYNAKIRNPFLQSGAYHLNYPVDAQLMDEQAKDLLGTHDFTAFMAAGSEIKTTVRTLTRSDVYREGDLIHFRFAANGFLYNMVRIMTGTLLYIASGKLEKNCIPALLASKDRTQGGITVPGCGLYLCRVEYDREKLKG